jgi:voltage-gated potassium channel
VRREATHGHGESSDALERFEQQTALPMLVLSLAIVTLLVVPLIFDLSEGAEATLFALDWFIWAVFAVEYGIRLFLAPQKGEVRGPWGWRGPRRSDAP